MRFFVLLCSVVFLISLSCANTEDIEKDLKGTNQKIEEHSDLITNDQTKLDILEQKLNSLLEIVNNNIDAIDLIESDIESLQTDVNANSLSIETVEGNIENLNTKTNNNTSDIDSIETTVASNTTEINNTKSTLTTVQSIANTNSTNIAALQTSVSSNNTNISGNTTSIDNILSYLEHRLDENLYAWDGDYTYLGKVIGLNNMLGIIFQNPNEGDIFAQGGSSTSVFYYTSVDCSGQGYVEIDELDFISDVKILNDSNGDYYVTDGFFNEGVSINSYKKFSNGTCESTSKTIDGYNFYYYDSITDYVSGINLGRVQFPL